MTAVAVAWQVYVITRSSFMVGLIGGFALIPLVVFGLYGGAIADVVDRRLLMLWTAVGLALLSAVLLAQALLGLESVWLLYLVVALQSGLLRGEQPGARVGDPSARRRRAAAGGQRAAAGDVEPRASPSGRCSAGCSSRPSGSARRTGWTC